MPQKGVDEIYQKKTQHEHILARPEMYIGTIETVTDDMWVYDESTETMVQRKLTWVPGLFKIFDEILVNAADNKVRDPSQSLIEVTINREKGEIRVWNNGEGIPVQIHKKHNLWIPEMIFGHLLTSSNYDDTEAKVTGGRNGFGAKLTNVFSTKFVIETCHGRSRKKFRMVWDTNMLKPQEPQILPIKDTEEDYTCVTFRPDFAKFGLTQLDDDTVALMTRRVYDIAGCTDKSQKVRFNGKTLRVRTFPDYIDLFPTMGEEKKSSSYSRVNDRWEVCVRVSNIGYQQMSFVNSIATTRGGTHVKYITDQILDKVAAACKKKHKDIDVKPYMIRPHLFVFINSAIENPSFDSQTKETLNTTKPNFGSECQLPQGMIDYILKSGVVERASETATSKLTRQMASKVKAAERGRITGIPKLEDANDAGTRHSQDCTLILTEGDSAKALAISGISAVGRDRYGVFPLRGKPLNVRDASVKKVLDCEEIQAVMKIMGLKVGVKYESTVPLRYGHLMIMADQDHDGSHIKGLIVNFVHFFWPSLIRIPGFLVQFVTPIVKALPTRRGQYSPRHFFSLPDFFEWRRNTSPADLKHYNYKYYKGLGTSTATEGREYFENLRQHRIEFVRESEQDDDHIGMAFAKDRVDDRKKWITAFNPETSATIDFRVKRISYSNFVDRELILFSIADCERSIPSIIDGLKPSQRKILYGCFKRNLTRSIKVAQLAGYVSEHAAYHHGEASLTATIVGLAQNYVGANNIPLMVPEGQFGTRHAGGKDSASARYIFTCLANITRSIYVRSDDFILDYKDDDGFPVEPHFYVPIIPMVLVNGTSGIGTGFATSIPNYNPLEIIANVRRLIAGADLIPMQPWYFGFNGTIESRGEIGKFVSKGKFTLHPNGVITVSELPIESWTTAYKKYLEELIEKELVLAFREHHTEAVVDFDIVLHPEVLRQWTAAGILEEKLQLGSNINATNIIGFNDQNQLTKYLDVEAVLKEFFLIRLNAYSKRKEYLIAELQRAVAKLQSMVRFVGEVIDGTMVVNRKRKMEILRLLKERGYAPFPPIAKKKFSKSTTEVAETTEERNEEDPLEVLAPAQASETPEETQATRDYEYLLGLKLWNFTYEMIERLKSQLAARKSELAILESKTPCALWEEDLTNLENAIKSYFASRDREIAETLRRRKGRREIDVSRLKVPVLGDKARKVLAKDAEKNEKAAKKAAKSEDGGQKRKKRRKKKDPDDDDASYSDWESGSDDDDDNNNKGNDKDEMTIAQVAKSRPRPRRKEGGGGSSINVKSGVADDDDIFDLDAFGLDAGESSKPILSSAKPRPAVTPTTTTTPTTEGAPSFASKPRKAPAPRRPAAKKAPAKKRKRRSSDSDSDESESEDESTESFASDDSGSGSESDAEKAEDPPVQPKSRPREKPAPKTAALLDDDDDLFTLLNTDTAPTAPAKPAKEAPKKVTRPRSATGDGATKPKPKRAPRPKASAVTKEKKPAKKRKRKMEYSDDEESGSSESSKSFDDSSSSDPSDFSD